MRTCCGKWSKHTHQTNQFVAFSGLQIVKSWVSLFVWGLFGFLFFFYYFVLDWFLGDFVWFQQQASQGEVYISGEKHLDSRCLEGDSCMDCLIALKCRLFYSWKSTRVCLQESPSSTCNSGLVTEGLANRKYRSQHERKSAKTVAGYSLVAWSLQLIVLCTLFLGGLISNDKQAHLSPLCSAVMSRKLQCVSWIIEYD